MFQRVRIRHCSEGVNEEVQQKLQAEKVAKKRWEATRLDIDKEYYKQCSKEAKRSVSIAKSDAYMTTFMKS